MQKSSVERIRELTDQLNQWPHDYYISKAQSLGIPVLSELEFLRMLGL